MKYIDADKLIAEIEKLLAKAKNDEVKAFAKKDAAGHLIAVTKTAVCVKIKKLIASLQQEQPEVDLEKEIQIYDNYLEENGLTASLEAIARHFFELGFNARKEDEK